MNRTTLVVVLLIGVFLGSCQKHKPELPDLMALKIEFLSPQKNQVFAKGDTVHFHVEVQNPSQLHGYQLRMINIKTGEVIFQDEQHVHSDHFTVMDSWVNDLQEPCSLSLKMTVIMDHEDNAIWKEVRFETR